MFANFSIEQLKKMHPANDNVTLVGYRFDDEPEITIKPEGFSVPVTVEAAQGADRVHFENTLWVHWQTGLEDRKDWFGKQSCYFADYLSVTDKALYDVIEPMIPQIGMGM